MDSPPLQWITAMTAIITSFENHLILACADFTHLAPYSAAKILGMQGAKSNSLKEWFSKPRERLADVANSRRKASGCHMQAAGVDVLKLNLMGDTTLAIKYVPPPHTQYVKNL
jgi:hypothetical protein